MDKRLQVVIDHSKAIKDAAGNDVNVMFSVQVPYGVPYDLAFAALDEIVAELKEMQKLSEKKEPSSEPLEAEVVS